MRRCYRFSQVLWQFVVARLRAVPLGAVLNLDSTVFERYGRQEGSLKGHNDLIARSDPHALN